MVPPSRAERVCCASVTSQARGGRPGARVTLDDLGRRAARPAAADERKQPVAAPVPGGVGSLQMDRPIGRSAATAAAR